MPSAERSVVIDRPVEEVFAFFTDPTNESRWRPQVKEFTAAGPVGVGSRIHQVIKGPGGRGIPADIEITGYEPPSRYAFKGIAGPVRPVGEYRFAGQGGTTTVTFSLDAGLTGLKRLVMSRPVQRSMDEEMAALDRAKTALEGG